MFLSSYIHFFSCQCHCKLSDFLFFTMPPNDQGYGRGRVADVFAVAQRQSECGRKTRKMHVSQPVTIGVCYAFGVCCVCMSI
jgi:hypothetical protein